MFLSKNKLVRCEYVNKCISLIVNIVVLQCIYLELEIKNICDTFRNQILAPWGLIIELGTRLITYPF